MASDESFSAPWPQSILNFSKPGGSRPKPFRTFTIRSSINVPLTLYTVLALVHAAVGGGIITSFTQAELETALADGGAVVFGTNGTVVLSRTIAIAKDASLDANGYSVKISGAGAVRLFEVNTNVQLEIKGVSLADGLVAGTNGQETAPSGQDGYGAGILNLGGLIRLLNCSVSNCVGQGGNGVTNYAGVAGSGGRGFGAALCNLGGQLYLTNCTLLGNLASGGQGSISSAYSSGNAMGGAIWSDGGLVSLHQVTLAFNRASGGLALSPQGNNGGAGDGLGGAIFATSTSLYVGASVLISNTASGGAAPDSYAFHPGSHGGSAVGGAMLLSAGSSGSIALSTFQGNSANGGTAGRYNRSGDSQGGHIFNAGNLEISGTTFSGASSAAGIRSLLKSVSQGGAICSVNSLVINGCTLNANAAIGAIGSGAALGGPGGDAEGGGLWISGVLAATNCTLVSNFSAGGRSLYAMGIPPNVVLGDARGGGVWISNAAATLVNLTIAANQVQGGSVDLGQYPPPDIDPLDLIGAAEGGALWITNSTVTLLNTILANSIGGGEVSGSVTDRGYNLCSDATAQFSAPSSHNHTDPLLNSLSDNGGPTLTMALRPGSPAIDAIASGFPLVDQRGSSRPRGPSADIGAFEVTEQSSEPGILLQPAGATEPTGNDVVFTIGTGGGIVLSYQWYKDGTPILDATNSLLTVTNVQPANAGAYFVEVVGPASRLRSEAAFLAVEPAPAPPLDPRDLQWRFSGTTNSLRAAAYGEGLLVVVGEGGTILSSTDTVTWTRRQSGTTADLRGVAYGNGSFVAVGGTTKSEILISPDGIVWTSQPATPGKALHAVAWMTNTFVAVGEQGTILVSTDGGVGWNDRSRGLDKTLFAVAAGALYFSPVTGGGGPLFVAVGEQGTLLTSPDGASWDVRDSGTSRDLFSVASVATRRGDTPLFLAAGAQGTAVVSTNGVNWAVATLPTDRDLFAAAGVGAFGNDAIGQYALAGSSGAFLTSTDGTTWSTPASGITGTLRGLLPLSGQFLAVGDRGEIRCGLVFLERDSHVSAYLRSVAWGNGTYVAVGGSGTIVSSADGRLWTALQLRTNDLYSVAFGNGRFVAVGTGASVLVSTNGLDWLEIAVPLPPAAADCVLRKVAFGNRTFIAEGYHSGSDPWARRGLLALSLNGFNWKTTTTMPPHNDPTAGPLCAGPDTFIAGGTGLFTSADGMSWTERVPQMPFSVLAYGSRHYLALDASSEPHQRSAATSNDGKTWNLVAMPYPLKGVSGLAWGAGSFLSAGTINGVAYVGESPDGVNWHTGVLSSPRTTFLGGSLFDIVFGADSFVLVGTNGLILQSAPRVVPPQLGISLAENHPTLTVISEPNRPVQLQSSTNLLSWELALTLTPTNCFTHLPIPGSTGKMTFFRLSR